MSAGQPFTTFRFNPAADAALELSRVCFILDCAVTKTGMVWEAFMEAKDIEELINVVPVVLVFARTARKKLIFIVALVRAA